MIYDVGSSELPSDAYDPTTGGASRDNKPGIRGLGGGTDPGEQSDKSPIGEPLALLAFAALFAGAIALRRAKQVQQRS